MRRSPNAERVLGVERLESRYVLSFVFGDYPGDSASTRTEPMDHDSVLASAASAAPAKSTAPAIRLDLVALHEFGHSLGLDHNDDPASIMYPYYNASYDTSSFASDSAVQLARSIYSATNVTSNQTPWKDQFDPQPGNGQVEITYSYVPDGTLMERRLRSTLFSTFNTKFGSADVWQSALQEMLNLWASAVGTIAFVLHSDVGRPFDYAGAAQNDPGSGDIRIAAHRMDGAGKTLAHAYFPPPNGTTAAGDVHFDQAENWVLSGGFSGGSSSGSGQSSSGGLRNRNMEFHTAEASSEGIEGWVWVVAPEQHPRSNPPPAAAGEDRLLRNAASLASTSEYTAPDSVRQSHAAVRSWQSDVLPRTRYQQTLDMWIASADGAAPLRALLLEDVLSDLVSPGRPAP